MVAVHRAPLVAPVFQSIHFLLLAAACGVPDGFCSSRLGGLLQMFRALIPSGSGIAVQLRVTAPISLFAVAIWR